MAIDTGFWQRPANENPLALYRWALALVDQLRAGLYRETVVGQITLTAGTTTTLTNDKVLAGSFVSLTPRNAAAASLTVKPWPSTKNQGVSIVLTHGTAAGTETFDYLIVR